MTKERKNYYAGPTPPKTRLDKPTLTRQRISETALRHAIERVIFAYMARNEWEQHFDFADDMPPPPDLFKAIDELTREHADLREILAKRAKRVPRVPV